MSEELKAGVFGFHAYHRHLPAEKRLTKPCADCPFVVDFNLAPGRLDAIKFSLSMGQPFWCHKTVHQPKVRWGAADDDEGPPDFHPAYRMCEGAAIWLESMMQKDGRDHLADHLGVKTKTVRGWLRHERLPAWVQEALRDGERAYFVGRKSDGTIDLIMRCHDPQLVVMIHPERGPDHVIRFAEVSEPRFRQIMLDVRVELASQWQLP